MNEKIILLRQIIKKHDELGKRLLKKLLPNDRCMWSPLQKPEFDVYDDVKGIKYIKEQRSYFDKYYILYIENYVKTLEDLACVYDEVYFVEFDCFEKIKNKTLKLIPISDDEEKYKLKKIVSERLRGYKKFNNSAWSLTPKQLGYFTEIENLLVYENSLYDYIFAYQYHVFLDDEEVEDIRRTAIELIKFDDDKEDFLLTKCENKRDVICDIYKYKHEHKHNIKFIKKLYNDYEYYVETYLRMIYSNESLEEILKLYNNEELSDISIENRIFILSNMGYNKYIYNEIKGKDEECIYWQRLNIFDGDKNDFVYDSCLKYGNYELCLDMIYELPDKYDEKCLLLEKIKESKFNPSQIDEYKIKEIFESFYNYTQITNFERLAKLEIYYSPILENATYFLSKQASKSPGVVAELIELVYNDENGNFLEFDNREIIVANCYDKLKDLKVDFNDENSLNWCEEFIKITTEKKRLHVAFHVLGQLLARGEIDKEDKMFPSRKVREIIEYFCSEDLAHSFEIEKYNQRGMHWVGIGEEEIALYNQYLDWSNKMKIEYPETSRILKNLAERYKRESVILRDEANYI